MWFPRQEYWSGLPFPSPGDLLNPGIESVSPALQADSLPLCHLGSPWMWISLLYIWKTNTTLQINFASIENKDKEKLEMLNSSSGSHIRQKCESTQNIREKWKMGIFKMHCVLIAQLCLTLCDPRDCSPPGFSVHGILQARILEWTAIPFSRGTSQHKYQTLVSYLVGRFFTILTTGKP